MDLKIGILGGTFNPIHNGHINIANNMMDKLGLDKVLFILTAKPPHKAMNLGASDADRIKMLELATADNKSFFVSDLELIRGGKSYTYDTITVLKDKFPNSQLFLICGSDMFFTLDKWHMAQEIMNKVVICASARYENVQGMQEYATMLENKFNAKCKVIELDIIDISSSEIRKMIKNGDCFKTFVSSGVFNYIKSNKLYL